MKSAPEPGKETSEIAADKVKSSRVKWVIGFVVVAVVAVVGIFVWIRFFRGGGNNRGLTMYV
jgi:hypothetical protein